MVVVLKGVNGLVGFRSGDDDTGELGGGPVFQI